MLTVATPIWVTSGTTTAVAGQSDGSWHTYIALGHTVLHNLVCCSMQPAWCSCLLPDHLEFRMCWHVLSTKHHLSESEARYSGIPSANTGAADHISGLQDLTLCGLLEGLVLALVLAAQLALLIL